MNGRLYYDLRGAQSVVHPERGIARWVANLAQALVDSERVDDLWLVVDKRRPIPGFAEALTPAARIVSPEGIPASERERPAVFHLTSPFELDYRVSELLPPRLRTPEAALVATLYDVIPLVFPEVYDEWVLRLWSARIPLLDMADRLVSISQYSAIDASIRLELPQERIRVVGTGAPAAASVPERPPERSAPYVLYAGGTEHPRKNIPSLIRAFSQLPVSTREAHELVVVGRLATEAEDELRGEADAAGVSERTTFTGYVDDDQLAALYAHASCFAYPSRYEGFGLPIAEAMSHGAPVIASRTTSCGELLPAAEAGFDPDDVGEIARVLERVLTDQAFADRLRAEGRRIASTLTWAEVADRCIDTYEEVVSSSPSARALTVGARTTTFHSETLPDPATPAAAFVQTAAAAAEHVRTEVATPAVVDIGPVGRLTPRRTTGNAGLMHGPLCVLVDSPESAEPAADLLMQQQGAAVLWELDLALRGSDDDAGDAIRRICETDARIIVGSDLDAARLSIALDGGPRVEPGVVPTPIAWNAGSAVVGHTLPFEAVHMIARGRRPSRDRHSMRMVLAARPPRYGPWPADQLRRLAALSVEIRASGERVRLVVIGETEEQDRLDAVRDAGAKHAGDAFLLHAWPAFEEMCALLTGAEAMVSLGDDGPSLAEATERQAILGLLPLVTGRQPTVAPEACVHVTTSAPSDWSRAISAVIDDPPDVPTPADLGRTPRDAATALLSFL